MPRPIELFISVMVSGCLVFTAKVAPDDFPEVSIASMKVLTVLLRDDEGGEDRK